MASLIRCRLSAMKLHRKITESNRISASSPKANVVSQAEIRIGGPHVIYILTTLEGTDGHGIRDRCFDTYFCWNMRKQQGFIESDKTRCCTRHTFAVALFTGYFVIGCAVRDIPSHGAFYISGQFCSP